MAIVRPWHIRALVKLVGKTKAYQWHNQVVESSANTYWQQVFSQLQTEPPASLTEEVERQVYRQLMEKGIAFANAADFLQSDLPLLQAVEADYEAWSQSLPPITDVNNKKAYEQKRYPGRHYRQTTDPDIQLALHPRFTRLAEAYLHAPASLFYADYWHTVVSPVQQRVASQNWHRDLEDKRLLKVFIYFNDITEENGAFEYAQYSALPLKYGQQFPHRLATSVYGADMNNYIEKDLAEFIIRGKGPRYTIVFADTTGFHRGGFATRGERKLFHFFYTSQRCPHQFATVFKSSINLPAHARHLVSVQ